MADKRAYFKLDVGYLANPKVATLLDDNPRAILLHLQCIAYSAQHLTDGIVPVRMAMRLACAEQCDLDLLVQCGLVEVLDERRVAVHDYLEHQRPASEAKRASEQAKRAAEARWSDADSNADSMPGALPTAMPREKREKRENKPASAEAEREFAEFWSAYPKKKDKGHAVKAYRTARKKASADDILGGLRRQLPMLEQAEERFRPYAATWLNGERWLDEPGQAVASSDDNPWDHFVPPPAPPEVADDPAEYDRWLRARRAEWDARRAGGDR